MRSRRSLATEKLTSDDNTDGGIGVVVQENLRSGLEEGHLTVLLHAGLRVEGRERAVSSELGRSGREVP